MRKHLGVILWTPERLDPLCRPPVLLGTGRARNLTVRDVTDKQMPERVFIFTSDRGSARPLDEFLSPERVEPFFDGATIDVPERGQRPKPEDFPQHRCVLDELLLLPRQSVEARRDDALHRLRHGKLSIVTALEEHARVLLGIQRVAPGPREQCRLHLHGQRRATEKRANQARRLYL